MRRGGGQQMVGEVGARGLSLFGGASSVPLRSEVRRCNCGVVVQMRASFLPEIYLSIYLSDAAAAAAAAALARARAEACESAVRAASAQAARKVWGIGVRLVCIIASFNYSAVSSSRFCPSSGAWGCGGRPRRSIRWLTPLGRRSVGLRGRPPLRIRWLTPLGRSVGLRRQAAAEHPLANTP